MGYSISQSLVLAIVLGFLTAAPAPAEVRDVAEFFSKGAVTQANEKLAKLQRDTGKEVRIDTLGELPNGQSDEVARMNKAERERYFENLARERATAEHVKGIYILITRHPGHVQIEVDRQTRNQGFGVANRDEVRDTLVSGFQKKEYDRALLDSVDHLNRTLRAKTPARGVAPVPPAAGNGWGHRPPVGAQRAPAPARPRGTGLGWMGWILVAVIAFLAIRFIALLFGSRSYQAPAGGPPGPYGGGPGGGYGPGFGGGGGGGFTRGLFGGMLGGFAGNWLAGHLFGHPTQAAPPPGYENRPEAPPPDYSAGAGQDFQGTGGDFDDTNPPGGGGDFGGGDFGGGDSGGGDFGAGDFGGDSGGGGDFGNDDSGGGDF
jgi:hypothetical protein